MNIVDQNILSHNSDGRISLFHIEINYNRNTLFYVVQFDLCPEIVIVENDW